MDTKIGPTMEILSKLAENAAESGFYFDANYLDAQESRLILFKENSNYEKSSDKGVKMRIWDGEKFLEYGLSSLEENNLRKAYENILEKAKKNQNSISEPFELDVDKIEMNREFKSMSLRPLNTVSIEEKNELLSRIKEKILAYSEDIVNVRVGLIEEREEHLFINNYKRLFQEIDLGILIIVAFVRCDDGSTKMVYKSLVDNGAEVFEKAHSKMDEFFEEIEAMKKAKILEGGKYKVVLAPGLSGLLAHESFGHGMEADTLLKDRALASEWMGKKIGGEFVNIVDYPNLKGKHGEFFFDFEGNLAQKTYLVKEGVINEPISDIYSKTRLKLKNSANARFESYDHKHYTRMSNTYFEPGDKEVEELIAQVDDGIFIRESHGGMEDPKGWGVQLQGCFGQRIKDGKLVDEYYEGFSFNGFLPDIIKNIKGVSKAFEIEGGGMCGKGHKEYVRVSEGGPYMLINEVILG